MPTRSCVKNWTNSLLPAAGLVIFIITAGTSIHTRPGGRDETSPLTFTFMRSNPRIMSVTLIICCRLPSLGRTLLNSLPIDNFFYRKEVFFSPKRIWHSLDENRDDFILLKVILKYALQADVIRHSCAKFEINKKTKAILWVWILFRLNAFTNKFRFPNTERRGLKYFRLRILAFL